MNSKLLLPIIFTTSTIACMIQLLPSTMNCDEIRSSVYTSLENRLLNLKKLPFQDQPPFIQKNPTITVTDLVEAVYLNDDSNALEALTTFFKQDSEPIYNQNQLKEFLNSNDLTASIWRNNSSSKCIITVNARRADILNLSIEHEITHVMQHADVKYMSESDFIKSLHASLEALCPAAITEINAKYENYHYSLANFDTLSDEQKFETRQVLLEYSADIQGCILLKTNKETIDFIKSKLATKRPKAYPSYALMHSIMNID